jgi:hypothetical protein
MQTIRSVESSVFAAPRAYKWIRSGKLLVISGVAVLPPMAPPLSGDMGCSIENNALKLAGSKSYALPDFLVMVIVRRRTIRKVSVPFLAPIACGYSS